MRNEEGGSKSENGGSLNRSCSRQLFCLFVSAFCLLPSAPSFGQVKGEVESIGFENYYRPECWTQMVVRLTPESDHAADYLIRVYQQDMDRDRPIFQRQITVTGTDENGNARDQRFRIYFKPTPTDGGLPDPNDGKSAADLQKVLNVEIATTAGKFIAALPITNTVLNVDEQSGKRGSKLVLAVTSGRSMPPHREYDSGVTIGLLEQITMVPVNPSELPENPIGYDAVDAVLWLDPNPDELTAGGDERLRALQNYVRGGGHLIICQQSDEWQKSLGFGDMLPVTITGVRAKGDAEPLKTLAKTRERAGASTLVDPWDFMHGPMTLGIAAPRPGAYVDQWITWPDKQITPYLARKTFGCGCVTWVAQDLGDHSLTSIMIDGERLETIHWPAIWNRVLDLKDDPLTASRVTDSQKALYTDSSVRLDVGRELNDQTMELATKGLWFISVAVIFFIAYWLVAGPGAYFFLLAKGRSGANWFVFAAAALVFTLLTTVLVDVIVRGPPDLKHFSIVRAGNPASGESLLAHIYSRFGLYIPLDGEQKLEIKDASPGTAANLSAYAVPPGDLKDAPNDIGPQYVLPISDAASGESTVVHFPYRRTLKKFEADETTELSATGLTGGIEGSAKIVDGTNVEGKLTNGTGRKLRDVYFAYKWHSPRAEPDTRDLLDHLIFIPEWAPGVTLDLAVDLRVETDHDGKLHPVQTVSADHANPDNGRKCHGTIQRDWEAYWLRNVSSNLGGDETMDLQHSLIVLSLFDRLAPTRRADESTGPIDLIRRGARRLDCSAALASGSMVIIAGEDVGGPGTLPLPLEVNGDRITGNGERLYQFVIPMDNSFETSPTTAPSE